MTTLGLIYKFHFKNKLSHLSRNSARIKIVDFETKLHTCARLLNFCSLRFFPDTLLGSSDIEDYYNEEVKAYYFDRHRGMFTAILFFYQSRGVFRSPTNIDRDIVEEELEFFKVQFC